MLATALRRLSLFGAAALLAGCGQIVPEPEDLPPPGVAAEISRGPDIRTLSFTDEDARGALVAFRASCPQLLRREDASGLIEPAAWRGVCDLAAPWPANDAARFFTQHFETAQLRDGRAFATGYFEPSIEGSRTRLPGYDVPVYAMPDDLVRAWPKDMPESERTGRPPLGRINEQGEYELYYDRAAIEDGALAGRGLEIAWAKDPIEFFFLQIQGSGMLRAPDGSIMRIGYAGQNGREYVSIGGVMRERGLLGDGPGQYAGSMQGIVRYLREHPEEGRELMRLNKSWIFFRGISTGPVGAMGVEVTEGNTVATDPAYIPLGAPVWLDLDRDVADGLWVAQDTGGAIKGPNRFDTFWGNGDRAAEIAGGMSGRGQAYVLLPRGTLERRGTR